MYSLVSWVHRLSILPGWIGQQYQIGYARRLFSLKLGDNLSLCQTLVFHSIESCITSIFIFIIGRPVCVFSLQDGHSAAWMTTYLRLQRTRYSSLPEPRTIDTSGDLLHSYLSIILKSLYVILTYLTVWILLENTVIGFALKCLLPTLRRANKQLYISGIILFFKKTSPVSLSHFFTKCIHYCFHYCSTMSRYNIILISTHVNSLLSLSNEVITNCNEIRKQNPYN